jgi:hypothetical protein
MRQGLVDFIENTIATISRWALAPVFGQLTAANADRLIKSTSPQAFRWKDIDAVI